MSPSAIKKLKEDEVKLLSQFVDLLDKMLALEPGKRLTPKVSSALLQDKNSASLQDNKKENEC